MSNRRWLMGLMDESQTPLIWIKLDGYDPELNKLLKAELPGPARWNRDRKVWMFPLHWDTCVNTRKLANKFDVELSIAPALSEWAIGEKARRATIPDVQSMALTELPCVRKDYPEIWEAISSRPFQTVGAAFAARNRSCLIADQPGLGKTLQAIAAVIEADIKGPILVVAPKAAASLVWPQELKRWVPDDEVLVIGTHFTPSERKQVAELAAEYKGPQRLWIITSPHYVRIKAEVNEYGRYKYDKGKKIIKAVGEAVLELFDVTWSTVIVDESHQTLAGASGDKKKQSAQRVGLGALDVQDNGLRIALSGTPFRGKEEYLWGQLNWLRPDLFRSRWRWMEKHFDIAQGAYGMVIGQIVDRKKMYEEAADVMIRRTKEEVAKDLPAKIINTIWLEMEGKQKTAYEQMVKSARADVEGGTLMTTGILAELTRLKQFAGSYGRMHLGEFHPTLPSNKFEWLIEFLDERGIDKTIAHTNHPDNAEVPKIVVASQFSKLIDVFAEGLNKQGIKVWRFTGGTSDKEREIIKDDFQNNPQSPVRVLLLTTTAGGVGLTLDAADELVALDETWNVSDQEQLQDRLHRLSRIHQVTIWNVRSLGSIEERIATANLQKDFSIKTIVDGSRGLEILKEALR